MGLDCPNVRHIIHWGPSADIESYIQETGRDGYLSRAVLYHSAADYRFSSNAMVNYCKNTTECNRKLLFNEFDEFEDDLVSPCTLCLCCDVCKSMCNCNLCSEYRFPVSCILLSVSVNLLLIHVYTIVRSWIYL